MNYFIDVGRVGIKRRQETVMKGFLAWAILSNTEINFPVTPCLLGASSLNNARDILTRFDFLNIVFTYFMRVVDLSLNSNTTTDKQLAQVWQYHHQYLGQTTGTSGFLLLLSLDSSSESSSQPSRQPLLIAHNFYWKWNAILGISHNEVTWPHF